MAEIYVFPERSERTWLPVAEALRSGSLKRTGSKLISDAVEARCRDVFERCVPMAIIKDATTPGEREQQLIDYIHNLAGALIGEIGLMAEEIELLKLG